MTENPFTDGQQFSSAILNSMYNAHALDGVLGGLDVVTGTNAWETDVSNGTIFLNNSEVDVTGTTLTHSSSDVEDRIDLIVADTTGLSIVTGDPASTSGQPIAPDVPADSVLVALIYIRGGSSEILSGDIFDNYKVDLDKVVPAFIDQTGEGNLDHSFLSNVQSDQHHTRPTNTDIFDTTTVTRTHSADTQTSSTEYYTVYVTEAREIIDDSFIDYSVVTLDGTSIGISGTTQINEWITKSIINNTSGENARDGEIELDISVYPGHQHTIS